MGIGKKNWSFVHIYLLPGSYAIINVTNLKQESKIKKEILRM